MEDAYLPILKFAYNNVMLMTTKFSPCIHMYDSTYNIVHGRIFYEIMWICYGLLEITFTKHKLFQKEKKLLYDNNIGFPKVPDKSKTIEIVSL